MAIEIPLNWENLGVLAGIGVFGCSAAWAVCRLISSTAIATAKDRAELEKSRSISIEDDLNKYKARADRANEMVFKLQRENSKFQADLDTLSRAHPESSEDAGSLQVVKELKVRLTKYDELSNALLGGEDDVWKLRGGQLDPSFTTRMRDSRVRVATVINLKGGVGKTTITANLAAHYAKKRGLRVLVLDLDYQGSLTTMMMLASGSTHGSTILADALLGGEIDGKWLAHAAREMGAILPKSRLVTCGQTFDGFENRLMLRWLLGEIEDDIRYRLANLLLSDEIQSEFDLVLIDAPPRLSTGAVNAICASHALLVPTVLDRLSSDAVARFLNRANDFRKLNPALVFAGVVGNLTKQTKLNKDEASALGEAKLALAQWQGDSCAFNTTIRHFVSLSRAAGRNLGYLEDKDVASLFDKLGAEISKKVLI